MPWDFEGKVAAMEYKTLRYPGHADIMRTIRSLGLLSTEPVDVKGTAVIPRDAFIACVEPVLRRSGSPDMVVLKVLGRGKKDGRQVQCEFELIDRADTTLGISAMMRTTGFSLAITGQMQADGRIEKRGVHTSGQCTPYDAYVEELAKRGVEIREKRTH